MLKSGLVPLLVTAGVYAVLSPRYPLAAGEGGLAPAYYVVYAFQGKHAGDMSDPSNIICVTTDTSYDLSSFLEGKHGRYSIVVTAVNRYRLESKPEEDISIRLK